MRGLQSGQVSGMLPRWLRAPYEEAQLRTPSVATAAAPARPARGPGLGERVRQLRDRGRSHPDRTGGRALLEGVHLADRARQDAADARDDQVARGAARRRRRLPRDRRLERRARAGRSGARPRRGALRARDYEDAIDEFTKALARGRRAPARSTCRCACCPARHGRGRSAATCARRSTCSSRRARSSKAP